MFLAFIDTQLYPFESFCIYQEPADGSFIEETDVPFQRGNDGCAAYPSIFNRSANMVAGVSFVNVLVFVCTLSM